MIVSIHQPNYLPWLGYFDKIIKSDIFVIFDDVQYPRGKKGFFGNRNQIKTNNGKMWLTVPVIGKGDFKNFNEIEINYNGWNKKHIQNIYNFYKKATYFDKYFEDMLKKSLLDENNMVIDVIVVGNENILDKDGNESEAIGKAWCEKFWHRKTGDVGFDWKQLHTTLGVVNIIILMVVYLLYLKHYVNFFYLHH